MDGLHISTRLGKGNCWKGVGRGGGHFRLSFCRRAHRADNFLTQLKNLQNFRLVFRFCFPHFVFVVVVFGLLNLQFGTVNCCLPLCVCVWAWHLYVHNYAWHFIQPVQGYLPNVMAGTGGEVGAAANKRNISIGFGLIFFVSTGA